MNTLALKGIEKFKRMETRIGSCVFDNRLQILKKDCYIIKLARKPALALKLMLSKKNTLVTRAELVESVWDGRPTSSSTMNQTIYLLRNAFKALNDNRVQIKSISHAGYVLTDQSES